MHNYNVDSALHYFPLFSNLTWQEQLQREVVQLSPAAAPHSYRFLPNAIVFWMQLGGARFDVGRDMYRLVVGLFLFYAVYRFARLYTNSFGALSPCCSSP